MRIVINGIHRLLQFTKKHILDFYLALAFAIFFVQAFFTLFFFNTWGDEANYLYVGWMIYERGLIPFHDIYMKVPPVIYYIFGFVQHFLGVGIYAGRLVSIIFSALMLLMLFKFSSKIGGKIAGLIAVWLIVSHPFSVQTYSTATTYSFAVFFAMASLFVLISNLKNPVKSVLSVVLMGLAILTRQNMGPAFILLLLYIFFTENKKTIFYSFLAAIIFPLVVLSPFLIIDFSQVVRQIFREVLFMVPFETNNQTHAALAGRIKMLFTIVRRYILFFVFLLSVIFVGFFGKNKKQIVSFLEKNKVCVLTALIFISIFFLHTFGRGAGSYMEYTLYSLPFAASLIGIGMARIYSNLNSSIAKNFLIAILISGFIFSPVFLTVTFASSFKDSDINRIKKAAEVLKIYTKPDDKIFTIDHNHHLLYADRAVAGPSLFYNHYSPLKDVKKVQEYFYFNKEMAGKWLDGEAAVVILQKERWREMMLTSFDKELLELVEEKLRRNYTLAASVENAYPRKYTAGKDTMDIYLLKKK